jgi:uncharacterized cofD-like protein
MKTSLNQKIAGLMLPGLKRWIAIILLGIFAIVLGVFLLLGYHPITISGLFVRELMEHAADVLPHRISGIIIIASGGLIVCLATAKMTLSVLRAYLPEDRESIPDVLYRRRHLDRGPRVVVIGGGTGLSNLLRGLKNFTNNITAIVTVADDGGSSGRLRQELGVLPPGDIRNCITALADEDKLVTELFRYRFASGEGLEGHSFGNLFLTALCAITDGDLLQSVRVASRVLNSCGQVLPSTLASISLVAEFTDGHVIKGESRISHENGRIARLSCEPSAPKATPEALEAIAHAELIILGPGSLYTSIIPNLLVQGIPEAIHKSKAKKIYVCNVMTQEGETTDYSVSDHLEALFAHANTPAHLANRMVQAALINDQIPSAAAVDLVSKYTPQPVRDDLDGLDKYGIAAIRRGLLGESLIGHHDPTKLAKAIMMWFYRNKNQKLDSQTQEQKAESQRMAPVS